jgi:DNA modification methylase
LISDTNLDQFFCDDCNNLEKFVSNNTVDLSIVYPPYRYLRESNSTSKFLKKILVKIGKITKPGGICCMIVVDDKDDKNNKMNLIATKTILNIGDLHNNQSEWLLREEIIWVKEHDSDRPSEEFISFEETPFSTIYILEKRGTNLEYVDRLVRLKNLRISEAKKDKMVDSVWYVPLKSEKKYHDRMPLEIVLRLLLLFTKKGDIVLDPYAGDGITAIICKELQRRYLCFEKNADRVKIAQHRLGKSLL